MFKRINVQGIKLSAATVAVCLFFFNLLGYTGFRHYISNDIFGGDTVNVVVSRMDSYTLKQSHSISDPSLFYAMLLSEKNGDPKINHNAFVYSLLSQHGKDALERLAKTPNNERDKGIFLLELNNSVIDREIVWPKIFQIRDSLVDPEHNKAGKLHYNLQVLSWLYPNNIRDSLHPLYQWKYDLPSLLETIPQLSYAYFTINEPTRYSPLVSIYTATVQMYLQNSPERIIYAIILTGLIYATLMLLVFLFAYKFIKSIRWSLIAVFLFQGAVSTILISIPLFSLPYMFVPLVMVGAIYAYMQYKDRGGVGWLSLYSYLAIIGPWFREFPGAIPFIVFANEVMSFKGRRSVIIMLTSLPLMLHSLYPSLLAWIIGINRGGVYNVLSQGNVQQVTNSASLNWELIGFLFVQFPPTLWLIIFVSMGYWLWRLYSKSDLQFSLEKIGFFTFLSSTRLKAIVKFIFILLLIAASCFIYSFFIANKNLGQSSDYLRHGQYLIGLIGITIFISFRFNTLLPIYLGATFLPFLRLGLAELHLSFVLIPLSIIFALWIKDLFDSIPNIFANGKRSTASIVLSGLLTIGLIDQLLNIPAAAAAQHRMVETNKAMGKWLKENTPRHSIAAMNFYNFTDVFYYSNYHFDPYETVENCPMGPTQVVHSNKSLENLFNLNSGVRDIYFIAAEHEFRKRSQESYHSHKFVRNPPGEIEKLAEFPSTTFYYYLDPLKYFVPNYFVSFIGYMDWSTDFYYGNTRPFVRKVYADYTVYRLKDISKGFEKEAPQDAIPGVSPPILVGSYQGYNIVSYNGNFYAVPQSLGALDLSKEQDRKHKEIIVVKDRKEIEGLIDKILQSQPKDKAAAQPPILVGSYKGYNIVDYNGSFYAVPQSAGALDLSKEKDRNHEGIIVVKDRNEIEGLVDKAPKYQPKEQPRAEAVGQPPILVGSYKGYNIVDYNGSFYVVPQSAGSLDLSKEQDRKREGIIIVKDRSKIEELVDKAIKSQPKAPPRAETVVQPPILVGSYKRYNIVSYNGDFYAVPQSVGALDLSKKEDRTRKEIIVVKDRNEIERLIDKTLKPQHKE